MRSVIVVACLCSALGSVSAAPPEAAPPEAAPPEAAPPEAAPPEAAPPEAAPPEAASAAPKPFAPSPGPASFMMIPRIRAISWNIEVEAGLRLVQSDGLDTFPIMGRLELGLLVAREPWFFAVSATGELGGLGSRGLGVQLELSHLWGGLWGHLGASWVHDDVVGNTAVVSTAVGWALVGVEWQRQIDSSDTLGDALMLELRVPLGTLYVVRYHQPTLPGLPAR